MRADNIRRTSTWAKALLLRPERRFWLMVGLIALGGAVLRGLVHEYGLPYIDDIDELKLWLYGHKLRGLPQLAPTDRGTYPPLFVSSPSDPALAENQGRPIVTVLDMRRIIFLANVVGMRLGRRAVVPWRVL